MTKEIKCCETCKWHWLQGYVMTKRGEIFFNESFY